MAVTKEITLASSNGWQAVAQGAGNVTVTPVMRPLDWAIADSTSALTLSRGHAADLGKNLDLKLAAGEVLQVFGSGPVIVTADIEVV